MSIDLARRDEAAVLTLNRPESLNALSFAIVEEIADALERVAASDARVLLVTGAGDRAFCAGADIKELRNRPALDHQRSLERGQAVFSRIEQLPLPSVAVLNGYAFGGGLELALACTFRIAPPNAKLGLPEIKLGMIPGYGGTQRLPRVVGEARALEIIMSGRTVDAEEAARIGLVSRIVEGDAEQAGLDFARAFTGYSLPVLRLTQQAVRSAGEQALADGLRTEAALGALAYQTADAAEGMAAFEDKRKPEFCDA